MDPESSDSDVSVGGGDEYRFASPLTAPIPLPPPASKHALESPDAVQARLDELQRVEDHNVKKYDLLRAKRARKDEKIRRRRDIQDKKWALIVEARQRRDARIEARRRREDAAFAQFDHELEEEESNLRRRLKRLKRGLPPDESPAPGGRSISSSSMSPPGPALSTLPPPPKRHQVGPPGQPDAVNPAQSRPSPQSNLAAPAKSTLPAPSYSFYRDSASSYSRPYHHSSYSTTPNNASPTITTNGSGHAHQPSADRPQLNHLGRPASPLPRSVPSTQSPVTPATNPNPPRQIYDTRPPPATTSSGFASINAPPASGFATINARTTATPPTSHVPMSRPLNDGDPNRTPNHPANNNGVEPNHFHSYPSAPTPSNSTAPTGSGSKRTPSTTHPYQMSEAFANRHHHCERVDTLNRGIWTSYGPGGTAEHPTGPAVEMYLRCNHDGCSRIDWRTVHGLQCHIVKNHDQPKGTIGSLDKALERYGVPVKEVEDFEFHNGRGTAGTMADPKNLKMKLKTKVQTFGRVGTPGSFGVDPEARPAGYRPSPAATDDSPTMSDGLKRSPDTPMTNGYPNRAVSNENGRQSAPQTAAGSPAITHTAVRPGWMGVNAPSSTPVTIEPEPKSLQGDFSSTDTPSNEDTTNSQPAVPSGETLPTPPSTVTATTSQTDSRDTITIGETVATAPKQQFSAAGPVGAEPLTSSTQTQPAAEIKREEEKGEGQELSRPKAKDQDVHMTGTSEDNQPKPDEIRVNGATNAEKDAAPEKPTQGPDPTAEQSDTIEIDGGAAKDASTGAVRRSTMQSPTITTRSLTATTPGSARRPSRRSSAARKSVDVDGEPGRPANNENDDKEKNDKDGKDEKAEKENTRLEPRRSLTGRLMRSRKI
ncbi:uncharacterized protein Z520_09603 [Fonsecaea multimorphosa CBS 102226]|uniref:Uncharacterized protein n=1 Tax=Fonsecaea multimorphosa CBS 102226 TaxID=1442371 RepID=A0A0D2JMM4_9EURO|nr:uncharacterized protein Z520_09603 [Fonsecaea multimorphosa CBS 102226]KIX94557.1 hypothetical protein Z520_09603 [Fonsecaea multimorphosa CBS 102226]